jgi:hypothetical protein
VEGGGGGLTVSGVSRNRGSFVKCVAIQKRMGITALQENFLVGKTRRVIGGGILNQH